MRVKERTKLALFPTERRTSRRESSSSELLTAFLHLDSREPIPVTITMLDLGVFGLSSNSDLSVPNGPIELQVELNGNILINGTWKLASRRQEGQTYFNFFEHPKIAVLKECGRANSPDTFLRKSRYRILDLTEQQHLADVSAHLTEMKDFQTAIVVSIELGREVITGKFDFRSDRKSFEVIEFEVDGNPPSLVADAKIRIEYSYLGVRYSFLSTIEGYDSDFSILSVHCFTHLVAITARRFDRHSCNIPLTSLVNGKEIEGILTQLSPTGGRLCLPDLEKNVSNAVAQLNVTSISETLTAKILHQEGSMLGIRFNDDELTRRGLHKLFVSILPDGIVQRQPKNYSLFIELFSKVGYAPSIDADFQKWQEETLRSWAFQDELMPGNCTGGLDGTGAIASSAGTLPFAEQVAYGHSFCMVKTAEGAATFLQQSLHSLAVSELIPGIKYYAGSYAKQSKFTTRLHVIFETHAKPDRQVIIHSEQLFPNAALSGEPGAPLIKVEELAAIEDCPFEIPLNDVIQLLAKPHQLLRDVHGVTSYLATLADDTQPCAIILKSKGWNTFTAAGMFDFTWIFSIREQVDLGTLCLQARRHPLFLNSPFQVIAYDGMEPVLNYAGTDRKKPAFWTITDKDDFGPIIASMSRAVHAILRKYGEAGLAEHMKVS